MVKEFNSKLGYCDRCMRVAELMWDGYNPALRVCRRCYDPPMPDESDYDYSDDIAIPNARPEPTPIYNESHTDQVSESNLPDGLPTYFDS